MTKATLCGRPPLRRLSQPSLTVMAPSPGKFHATQTASSLGGFHPEMSFPSSCQLVLWFFPLVSRFTLESCARRRALCDALLSRSCLLKKIWATRHRSLKNVQFQSLIADACRWIWDFVKHHALLAGVMAPCDPPCGDDRVVKLAQLGFRSFSFSLSFLFFLFFFLLFSGFCPFRVDCPQCLDAHQ